MNKKLIMTAAALLALTTVAGCEIKSGGNGSASNVPSDSSEADTFATVTFDLNYAGAPAAQTVQVEKGDYIDGCSGGVERCCRQSALLARFHHQPW